MNWNLSRRITAVVLSALLAILPAVPASAQFASQREWGGTSGGSANVQTVALANYGALEVGVPVRFLAGFSNSGATTINVNSTGAVAVKKLQKGGLVALTGGEIVAGQLIEIVYDGTEHVLLSPSVIKGPTNQTLTSGTGTYTTPAGVTRIVVRMVGGGGGGGGTGTTSPGAGGTGGTTTLGTVSAAGGGGGSPNSGPFNGGAGGAGGTGASGTATRRLGGGAGGQGSTTTSGTSNVVVSGSGGNSVFGGGGGGLSGTGTTNTGGGGGGAASGAGSITQGNAGGGGAGEYAEVWTTTPAASYGFTIGAGGTGGVNGGSGNVGGVGGTGVIFVDEFYD